MLFYRESAPQNEAPPRKSGKIQSLREIWVEKAGFKAAVAVQCVWCAAQARARLGSSSFAVSVTASNFTMLQKIIEKYVYVPLERNCKLEPALSDDYDHAEMAQSWTEKKAGQSTLLCKGHEAAPHSWTNITKSSKNKIQNIRKIDGSYLC